MNDNCLKGIRCPKCKQEDEFLIYASSWFEFTDEGASEFWNVDYNGDAPIRCSKCGERGTVAGFTVKEEEREADTQL